MAISPGGARPKGASDRFGTVDFALRRHVSPHGQVTAVSMMKDEGPFVIEWVAHHLAVGFTDLVVYTNDCSDGTDDMLIRLEELGLAHHRRNVIPEGIRPQPSALNHAQDEAVVQGSDWVMVFDADEFLSIRFGDGTLDDLIAAGRVQEANGIVVTWRIFGSGGVVEWSRAPVTEQYLMAAPVSWNKGWGVKTLFTFDADYWKLGIHRPKIKNRHIDTEFPDTIKWLNGSGRPMEDYFKFRGWRSITRTVGYDWVQLNHYAVKSVDSYAIRKMRGNVNNKKDKYNSDYWSLQDRNEERDDTMLRYTARRNEIIGLLLTDPVLARLHRAAVDRAEARLAELRSTQAYADLVADLAKASAVPISEIVAKPPQPRDKEKIASLMSEVEKRVGSKAKAERMAAPRDPIETVPTGNYRSVVEVVELQGEWVANHAIKLPLDARVFSEPALKTISKGKFDRGLARRMPVVLDRGARVLEVGAGVGFLGLHLSRIRPDLVIALQEDDAGLRAAMLGVLKANDSSFDDKLRLLGTSLDITLADQRSNVLLLADARLSPESVAAALMGALPRQIFLHGRLLEAHRGRIEEYDSLLGDLGYEAGYGFDPNLTRGYGLGGVDLA
ncbi:MAG: glycosyltransferase family 2 protein [Paracoccaceae bacterium]